MKIKAKDMKSCLNCRLADVFIIPDSCQSDLDAIWVECWKYPESDRKIAVGDECSRWEKKG